jgi:tetratricopeptide (TPR) repeat protein
MKLTRSQKIITLIMGLIIAIVGGFTGGVIVRNASLIAHRALTPTSTPLPPTPYLSPTPTPTATPTPIPSPTATEPPTPTPPPSPTPKSPPTDLDQAIADEPQNPYPRIERGYVYLAQAIYEAARDDFDAALALNDTLPRAYLGRAQARFYLKEWSAAMDDLEQAITFNPDLADAYTWQGYLFYHRGAHAPAIDLLRQAIAIDTAHGDADPFKYIHLGHALRESGRPASAIAAYDAALTLAPHDIRAHIGKAFAQSDLGDLEAMQVNLSHAMSAAPFDPVALNGRAWLYAQHTPQRMFEAQQLAQQAVDRAPTDLERARYLHTLAWITYRQNYHERATALLEEAAALATVEGEIVYDEIQELLQEIEAAHPTEGP